MDCQGGHQDRRGACFHLGPRAQFLTGRGQSLHPLAPPEGRGTRGAEGQSPAGQGRGRREEGEGQHTPRRIHTGKLNSVVVVVDN